MNQDDKYLLLLDLESGITLEELIEKVALIQEAKISIKEILLPAFVTGCTIRTDEKNYTIFYEKGKSGRGRDIVISHELGHILRGDLKDIFPIGERQFLDQLTTASSETRLNEIVMLRSSIRFDPERERETEQLACKLLEKVISPRMRALEKANQLWIDPVMG